MHNGSVQHVTESGPHVDENEAMKLKRWLRTRSSALICSRLFRNLSRSSHAVRRRLNGGPAVVHYFHQVDDPYSDLAVRALPHLAKNYRIQLIPHIVPAPDKGAAPEPEHLTAWSLRDATDLANALKLSPAPWQQSPERMHIMRAQATLADIVDPHDFTDAAAAIRQSFTAPGDIRPGPQETGDAAGALAAGQALRDSMGHYLGGTFYFEGEWYWGLDRLPYLEHRLRSLAQGPAVAPFVDRLECSVPSLSGPFKAGKGHASGASGSHASGPRIDLYFSFRSPYSYLALPRVIALARHYNAELRLRFVLPMVMRGLPIPESKRRYIVSDTKREAERVGLPFGLIADPVGKPTERGLAVLHHAIKDGKGEAFAQSFMRGVFAEGINARSDTGLKKLCRRAGIGVNEMAAALADPDWRSVAESNREEMFSLGIWGVPAFRVNGGTAHWGQDRLWLLEQQLQLALAEASPASAVASE